MAYKLRIRRVCKSPKRAKQLEGEVDVEMEVEVEAGPDCFTLHLIFGKYANKNCETRCGPPDEYFLLGTDKRSTWEKVLLPDFRARLFAF